MTARVQLEVSAEDIGNARPGRGGWADPVTTWLSGRWDAPDEAEPIAFDLELDDWLVDLVRSATRSG